jgi:hypothetical protein
MEFVGRRVLSIALVVVGGVTIMAGWFVGWVNTRLFDTERVTAAATAVVTDPEVGELLVREVTDRVMDAIDTPQLRPQVEQIVSQVQRSSEFSDAFAQATRTIHRDFVDGTADPLVFDLQPVALRVRAAIVATEPRLEPQLPPADTLLRFELARRSDIPTVWTVLDRLRSSGEVLLVFGGCLIALGLALGPGRWLRFGLAGAVVVVSGLGMITFVRVFSRRVQYRSDDSLARIAARHFTNAFTDDLPGQAAVIVLVGALMVVAAGVGAVITLDRR